MSLVLALVITMTIPSQDDVATIAALACGESCGMPRAAQELIIANLFYDAAQHGVDWLPRRWYAPPRPNAKMEALAWSVVERMQQGERWKRCGLIGSAGDMIFWLAGGYVEGDPDYQWVQGKYQVNAFGCYWPVVVFEALGCEGERCPQ